MHHKREPSDKSTKDAPRRPSLNIFERLRLSKQDKIAADVQKKIRAVRAAEALDRKTNARRTGATGKSAAATSAPLITKRVRRDQSSQCSVQWHCVEFSSRELMPFSSPPLTGALPSRKELFWTFVRLLNYDSPSRAHTEISFLLPLLFH